MNVSDKLSFVSTLHRAPYPAIDPRRPSSSAAGKTILITGGATGIGFAVARNFALAGASTIVFLRVVRKPSRMQLQSSLLHFQTPNSSRRQTSVHDSVVRSEDHVRNKRVGNLNVVNAFLDAPKKEGKVIVDFTSYASYMPFPQTGPYGASKAAFSLLMRHVQNEHPELRVYTLHPGAVWTQAAAAAGMTKDMLDWDDEDLPGQFVVWLAGQEAAFLKGRFLASHWDVTELMARKETFELDAYLSTIGLRR
ncbi:serine 3-dehydrogenase [Aspergillus udagawae]|uniref:Serine 3-dehydrogenase n=1 Tax=Aspergillus udagawae TaxID=91492 RepID=A0ABQ1AL79_9EURO|nr:serine 3-dehydrogenase [Aspergillus udagawae]GFF82264.1 serine 3-dehydrogenase [Aspergillus udagawae]GFG05800.1 serine 3-dehydrogenase [Aspergillus udagawae]